MQRNHCRETDAEKSASLFDEPLVESIRDQARTKEMGEENPLDCMAEVLLPPGWTRAGSRR